MYTGKVAHTACYDHKTLVLDGAGMGAYLNARIGVLRVGKERNEQYLHALVCHDARKFRELHVITYQHTDFGAVRIERLQGFAATQSPGS